MNNMVKNSQKIHLISTIIFIVYMIIALFTIKKYGLQNKLGLDHIEGQLVMGLWIGQFLIQLVLTITIWKKGGKKKWLPLFLGLLATFFASIMTPMLT
jgi:lysophospholipid acyltransferase (LPLAT)-like uncharacterized protein